MSETTPAPQVGAVALLRRVFREHGRKHIWAYAAAAATQPAFTHMDDYLRRLRRDVRRILTEHGIGATQTMREQVEDFAIHTYGDGR